VFWKLYTCGNYVLLPKGYVFTHDMLPAVMYKYWLENEAPAEVPALVEAVGCRSLRG